MSKIIFNKLIPELSVSNIENSKQFYLSLGFSILYERVEDKFCFLELDGCQLMIEEINDNWNTGKLEYPYGRGMNISMEVKDIDSIYYKVKELEIISALPKLNPLKEQAIKNLLMTLEKTMQKPQCENCTTSLKPVFDLLSMMES